MHTLEHLRSGDLAGTQQLRLSCGLNEFPPEIFDLADTLEILDLSGNTLTDLPDDLHRLHKLRVLFASNNRFSVLPEGLGRCAALDMVGFKANCIRTVPAGALPPRLRWLILTDNALDALPDEIGTCTSLQKLMLAGNRLSALPGSMAACTRLELLRISANELSSLPAWLLAMPRLSWLAIAGNPLAPKPHPVPCPVLSWQDLELGDVLGEGASGVIYRARYHGRDVAVKLFKGAVTSDGLPLDEMEACVHAGSHPALIPVLGRVDDHPAGQHALVMALIGEGFRPLAGPPSLETCTRDVYRSDTRLSQAATLGIARNMASALAHLHARGQLHGDLYAHNILHAGGTEALIGDFGAASFSPPDQATALQRLEVRAFGCLLEELAQHGETPDPRLASLAAACLTQEVAERPLFADLEQALA